MSDETDVLENIEKFNTDLTKSEESEEEDKIVSLSANSENGVITQLNEVIKEDELKTSQILDILDETSKAIKENISSLQDVLEFLNKDKLLLETLHQKFPNINIFKNELIEIKEVINKIENIIETNETVSKKISAVMDIMQYQNIHYKKVERVINIMRILTKYMNKLFEGDIEDEKQTKNENYIHGDENEEVLSDDDIESLLEKFGV